MQANDTTTNAKPYRVGADHFDSYTKAIAAAKSAGAEVFEVRADGTEIRRWAPAPKVKARTRHVIRNADGSLTEFGKIRK